MVMNNKRILPYGDWPSPINPELFANFRKLSEPCWLDDGLLVWRERSSGSSFLQMLNLNTNELQKISGDLDIGGELLYGGGGVTSKGNYLYGIDKTSHQLYKIGTHSLEPLTSDLILAASPRLSSDHNYIIFVHSSGEDDAIYIKDTRNSTASAVLVEGSDFL